MAPYNVLATFDSLESLRAAMEALERKGIDGDDISLIGPAAGEADSADTSDRDKAMSGAVAAGVARGAGIGTVTGGLLGLAAFAIPGVGPFVGAGVLAATFAGAAGGGAVGGVAGGVASLPVGEDWELTYADIREGRGVIAVHADDRDHLETAAQVLQSRSPLRIDYFGAHGQPLEI